MVGTEPSELNEIVWLELVALLWSMKEVVPTL
jgi:hypothetical protein